MAYFILQNCSQLQYENCTKLWVPLKVQNGIMWKKMDVAQFWEMLFHYARSYCLHTDCEGKYMCMFSYLRPSTAQFSPQCPKNFSYSNAIQPTNFLQRSHTVSCLWFERNRVNMWSSVSLRSEKCYHESRC